MSNEIIEHQNKSLSKTIVFMRTEGQEQSGRSWIKLDCTQGLIVQSAALWEERDDNPIGPLLESGYDQCPLNMIGTKQDDLCTFLSVLPDQ